MFKTYGRMMVEELFKRGAKLPASFFVAVANRVVRVEIKEETGRTILSEEVTAGETFFTPSGSPCPTCKGSGRV